MLPGRVSTLCGGCVFMADRSVGRLVQPVTAGYIMYCGVLQGVCVFMSVCVCACAKLYLSYIEALRCVCHHADEVRSFAGG